MSREAALAEARVLKGHLEEHGVRCSIELVEGTRKPYGWLLPPGRFRVEMSHHIVSRRSQGLTPFLALVKTGRVDVKGPLCNGYGGFDEVYRIITMGVANHSGRGGPMTVDGVTIAKDVAAYFAWGTEYEGGLDPADWSPSYRAFMGAANAGILDYLRARNGRTTDEAHCEHSTWAPGRKSDRMLYSRAAGIAEIKAHRARQEDDMALTQEERTILGEIRANVQWIAKDALGWGTKATPLQHAHRKLDLILAELAKAPAVGGDVDEEAIARAIAESVSESLGRQLLDELSRRLAA